MAIKIDQTYTIAAPREIVYEALNDPQVLKFCIPKCRNVRRVTPDSMRVSADIGVLRMTYRLAGLVHVTPLDDEAGYDVTCVVSAGTMKIGSVEGRILLEGNPDSTTINSSATLGPARKFNPAIEKLAEPIARSLSNAFFKRFGLVLSERV